VACRGERGNGHSGAGLEAVWLCKPVARRNLPGQQAVSTPNSEPGAPGVATTQVG